MTQLLIEMNIFNQQIAEFTLKIQMNKIMYQTSPFCGNLIAATQ